MKTLFDATNIKGLDIKNRFMRSAVHTGKADTNGYPTTEWEEIYYNLGKGGTDIVTTDCTLISKIEGTLPGTLGIYNESYIKPYKKITDKMRSLGVKSVMQLAYFGDKTNMLNPSDMGDMSKVKFKPMADEDIRFIAERYAEAAERAKKSGFDAVQIHHTSHSFMLSPYYTAQGGDIFHKARIIFAIYSHIREKVGNDYPVFIKIDISYFLMNDVSPEEFLQVCERLSEMGMDLIELVDFTAMQGSPTFSDSIKLVAEKINTPVAMNGGLEDYSAINDLLQNTSLTYFSLARPLIADPDLINKWQAEQSKGESSIL